MEFRKLTPHDLAFGIGRKATDEELREMLNRAKSERRFSAEEVLEEIKKRLASKRINSRYQQ